MVEFHFINLQIKIAVLQKKFIMVMLTCYALHLTSNFMQGSSCTSINNKNEASMCNVKKNMNKI